MSQAIVIPRPEPTPVELPPSDPVEVTAPVRSSTLRAIADAALFVGGFLDKRQVNHHVDYDFDTLTTDPSADGPSEVNVRFPASDRARWLYVAVRLQTSRAKGADAPELAARLLLLSDGSEIDKGMAWTRDALIFENDPDSGDFPPQWIQAGATVVAGTASETLPRLLNIDGNQDEWLTVELTADSARILAVYLSEWPDAVAAQEFSP